MQEVVNRILKGSESDAWEVLNESIETLQHTEYTIDHALRGLLYENETISLALAKLVACSKQLSLSFVSMRYINMCPKAFRLLRSILDIQKDEEIFNKAFQLIKANLLQASHKEPFISLLISQQDIFMDNLDLLLDHLSDVDFREALILVFDGIDYQKVTDKQFFKICEIYLSKNEQIENLALTLLQLIYYYGERPIHYPLCEKLIERHMTKIIRVNVCDLFKLMQRYPCKFQLLEINTPYIHKNEVGIEHCVKYIDNCFKQMNYNDNGHLREHFLQHCILELLCKFFKNVQDLSPFVDILTNVPNGYKIIMDGYKKFGTSLPKVLDFAIESKMIFSLVFLERVYRLYENKLELKNKAMKVLENWDYLAFHMCVEFTYMFVVIFEGDIPAINDQFYNQCMGLMIRDPQFVQHVPPKYTKAMIKHYIDNGNSSDLIEICRDENVRQYDQMVVDLIIESDHDTFLINLWRIAFSLKSRYAVKYAWIYGNLDTWCVNDAFDGRYITAPKDGDVVPKLIKKYLDGHTVPNGKLLAYLYNSTDCKLHIGLIKSLFRPTIARYYSMAHELLQMVLNLNKITNKQELKTMLAYYILHHPEKFHNEEIKRAMDRLGGSDECHALYTK